MKYSIHLLCLLFSFFAYSQATPNLDFETLENDQAAKWSSFGSDTYTIEVDTTIAYSGKNSGYIAYEGSTPDFKACSYSVPANYDGQKI